MGEAFEAFGNFRQESGSHRHVSIYDDSSKRTHVRVIERTLTYCLSLRG